MAFKNNNEATTSISSAPVETVISNDTKFRGAVETDKPLTIEGYFEGEIKTTSTVLVTEQGYVDATIECAGLTLLGKGKGNIACAGILEIGSAGEFLGDVVARDLRMADGAKLEGQCKIG